MTVYHLPALDKAAQIVSSDGRPSVYFQRFWQNLTFTAVEGANQNSDIASLTSQVTTLNGQMSTVNATLPGKQPLDSDLTAVAGLATTGLIVRTAAGSAATRTLTGTANEIAVSNGDGVSGDPTLSLPAALTFTGKTITGGTFSSPALTGAPTAPTASAGDNTTKVATTAFIRTEAVRRATFTTWTAATGTASRATFSTYSAPTISASPTQAEVQALADHVQVLSERLKALVDDLKT